MAAAPEKPRIRDAAGQFSQRGSLTAELLRRAYGSPRRGKSISRGVSNAVLDEPPLTFHAKGTLIQFGADCSMPEQVDVINAIIRGVSIITSGVIARGHDLEVDGQTLDEMEACAKAKGQVPVKVDHKSGAAAVCGFLTNFHQKGGKLLADWNLLMSHPQKDQILEVAQRMPRGVGLSAAFVAPEKPGRTSKGGKAARCQELISVDYVTLPAANPNGMFDAKVDTHPNAMNPETQAAIDAAVAKATAPLIAQINDQAKQLNLIANPPSLEQVAQMSEAELAELGLTPQDVQEALDAVAAEQDGEVTPATAEVTATTTETQPATTSAAVATPAAAAPVGAAAFNALQKQVVELSTAFKKAKTDAERAEIATLFEDTEKKVTAVIDENVRLHEALKSGGKPASAGVAGIRFFSAGADKGDFERLVQLETQGEKKLTKTQAFQAVIRDNPAAYQNYLVRLGVAKAE